jgi:hypothetical protein
MIFSFQIAFVAGVVAAAALTSGCVRTVTVCADARHSLQRGYPARDDAGVSVCAEVGPRD